MLSDLANRLDEIRMLRQPVSDLDPKESKVAAGMLKKGYRFIIWNERGKGKPQYAKSMQLAVELAGDMGKGTKVAVLQESSVEEDLEQLAQSIAELE